MAELKIETESVKKVKIFCEKIKNLNDPNFANVDLNGFGEEDTDFFKKFENGTLTKKEYDLYKASIPADDSLASKAKSRLLGYLGNKVMASGLMEKWSAEEE
jgi:hypothetical protein